MGALGGQRAGMAYPSQHNWTMFKKYCIGFITHSGQLLNARKLILIHRQRVYNLWSKDSLSRLLTYGQLMDGQYVEIMSKFKV